MARGEKIFKIDDVFVTGILAKEAGGVKHRFKCHHIHVGLNVIIFTSIFIDILTSSNIRSVGGMVGIGVGLKNAYSMLTGPFR